MIKIFFLIFSLQFFLYSCVIIKFYQFPIEKYSEITINPSIYDGAGFVLNIEDFKENEEIYFKISINELDMIYHPYLKFKIKFESIFHVTFEIDLNEFSNIDSIKSVTENSLTTFYFKTTKTSSTLKFLKIIFIPEIDFDSNVILKNTEEDESEEGSSAVPILIIFFSIIAVFIIIIVLICVCYKCKRAKTAKAFDDMYENNPQIYGQQIYAQPQIYGQGIYGQPINVQPQMNVQQINKENNLNNEDQNNLPSPLPINQQEVSPINQK